MFTGIIKDVGRVRGVTRRQGGLRLRVQYNNTKEFSNLSVDESVSINGACQTVVALGEGWFEVDTIEETLSKTTLGAPDYFSSMIVSAGSITIAGISLTVAKLEAQLFAVAIIPFTFAHTTINELKQGSQVNLEFDILGKYVARQLGRASSFGREEAKPEARTASRINEAWLQENGF